MGDAEAVRRRRGALAQGEEEHGVEQIRLALAVLSNETVEPGRERELCLAYVLIVDYGQLIELHVGVSLWAKGVACALNILCKVSEKSAIAGSFCQSKKSFWAIIFKKDEILGRKV